MEPLYAHIEGGTRGKVLLSFLGYAIAAIIANKYGMTSNSVLETMRGIKEVVHTSGSQSTIEP